MEARDASGNLVESDHVEVVSAGPGLFFGLAAAAFAGVVGVVAAPMIATPWLRWAVGAVAAIVGLVAVGSLGFALWGRYPGFNWHFTP